MSRELHALRSAVFQHSSYTEALAAKRAQLERRDGGPRHTHDTSCWSNVVQTWETQMCVDFGSVPFLHCFTSFPGSASSFLLAHLN